MLFNQKHLKYFNKNKQFSWVNKSNQKNISLLKNHLIEQKFSNIVHGITLA